MWPANMSKSINVKLENQTVEVKKLPIGDYAEVLRAVKKLPKHFNTLESLNTDTLMENLPLLFSDCLPDVIAILAIATKMPEDEVKELGLSEIVKLIEAVYVVNSYSDVYQILKKALAHPAIKEIQKPKTS